MRCKNHHCRYHSAIVSHSIGRCLVADEVIIDVNHKCEEFTERLDTPEELKEVAALEKIDAASGDFDYRRRKEVANG